ncbi:hypothetical protein K501DRAFT_282868 [Backusella circina FSU 941]|nr:hypothetical protein K501DRAFT_282868 [Backusella circina FSU 941]
MSVTNRIPAGFKPLHSNKTSHFDNEKVLDDDKEIWLIRVPDNITEEDLASMKIKTPSDSSKKAIAKFEKESNKYLLYNVPNTNFSYNDGDDEDDAQEADVGVSGQEMFGFDCIVPSHSDNGKSVRATKKIERCLILDEIVDVPDSTALAESIRDGPVYKREQPEGLQMRFKPFGYYSGENGDVEMDAKPVEKKRKKSVVVEEDSNGKKKAKKEKKVKKEKK